MGQVRDELDAALAEATPADRDRGAVMLAREYAAAIDDAGVPGKYSEALDWLVATTAESNDIKADGYVRKILLGLSHGSALSDFGPKLLATMESLQLTPRARAAAPKPGDRTGATNPVDAVAEKRRQRRAGNVA